MVELARVRTARPRLQLLAMEGVAVEVAVDDDVGVSAPASWRRAVVDGWNGVMDRGQWGFATGGEEVFAPTEYEWGIERVGGNLVSVWDALVFCFFKQKWDALV